jgi:spoIIIJ-associated protein
MAVAKQNESLSVSAKTIEEAVEQGLAQLGLTREQVEIEILKEGKRGVFGIGAEEALVRLIPKPQTPPSVAVVVTAPVAEPAVVVPPVPVSKAADVSAAGTPSPSIETYATESLVNLLRLMGIEAEVKARYAVDLVEEDEQPPLVLDISGGDLGILIGRQSETLQALQFMLRTIVSKHAGDWQPVVIDVESYRVRRRQSLQRLAERMAERVVATRKKVVLEAMPAHERRVIHMMLRDHPAVLTKSIGSDDNRKVTIIPK